MNARDNAIILWRFQDAPEELRIPYNGCDEDFAILIPPNIEEIPDKLERLGCSSNDVYRVNQDGTVDKREEDRRFDDRTCEEITSWERTDWTCPSYPGCTIIIASHA